MAKKNKEVKASGIESNWGVKNDKTPYVPLSQRLLFHMAKLGLNPTDIVVVLAVMTFRRPWDTTWPHVAKETLAERLHLSRSTVFASVKRMERSGYCVQEVRAEGRGLKSSVTKRLNFSGLLLALQGLDEANPTASFSISPEDAVATLKTQLPEPDTIEDAIAGLVLLKAFPGEVDGALLSYKEFATDQVRAQATAKLKEIDPDFVNKYFEARNWAINTNPRLWAVAVDNTLDQGAGEGLELAPDFRKWTLETATTILKAIVEADTVAAAIAAASDDMDDAEAA
jgi:hypothetical protein